MFFTRKIYKEKVVQDRSGLKLLEIALARADLCFVQNAEERPLCVIPILDPWYAEAEPGIGSSGVICHLWL